MAVARAKENVFPHVSASSWHLGCSEYSSVCSRANVNLRMQLSHAVPCRHKADHSVGRRWTSEPVTAVPSAAPRGYQARGGLRCRHARSRVVVLLQAHLKFEGHATRNGEETQNIALVIESPAGSCRAGQSQALRERPIITSMGKCVVATYGVGSRPQRLWLCPCEK